MEFLVKKGSNVIQIKGYKEKNLLEVLAEHSIFINAYCGGMGSCKKCIVRYLKNAPKPTKNEIDAFNESELSKGFRLACQHMAKDDTAIEVFESQVSFASSSDDNCCADDSKNYIALDIGTTTIAASLIVNKKVKDNFDAITPLSPHIRIVIFVDANKNDVHNSYMLVWRVTNNIDAQRDIYVSGLMVGVDGTNKTTLDGFAREWPDDVDCTQSVIENLKQKGIWDLDEKLTKRFQL